MNQSFIAKCFMTRKTENEIELLLQFHEKHVTSEGIQKTINDIIELIDETMGAILPIEEETKIPSKKDEIYVLLRFIYTWSSDADEFISIIENGGYTVYDNDVSDSYLFEDYAIDEDDSESEENIFLILEEEYCGFDYIEIEKFEESDEKEGKYSFMIKLI